MAYKRPKQIAVGNTLYWEGASGRYYECQVVRKRRSSLEAQNILIKVSGAEPFWVDPDQLYIKIVGKRPF